MRFVRRFLFAIFATLAVPIAPAMGASTAFRFTDFDLRDPHFYVSFLGCRDITDNPLVGVSINGDIHTRMTTDGDSNGYLDLSYLIVFDPLNPVAAGGPIRFGSSSCTAPVASTICGPAGGESLVNLTSTNGSSGSCLTTLAGTLRPYSPAVTQTAAPCFVSDPATLTLDLGGIPVTLRSARIAATYSGSPTSNLVNGLIRGFLTEADANATIVPASHPLIGGMVLSQLLPGGDPPGANNTNCAPFSDKDIDNGTPGWWMYLNFVASKVPYTGPNVGVIDGMERAAELSVAPNPFRSSVQLDCWLAREGPARVAVYDLSGRRVAELANSSMSAGPHRLTWDGTIAGRGPAPPGLYVIKLTSQGRTTTKQVVRVR